MRKRISIILVVLGLIIYVYIFLNNYNNILIEKTNIDKIVYDNKYIDNTYDLVLSIPKINLRKGIYKKDDNRNDINYGIKIHSEANYPNEINSNLILLAHSGTSDISYFNNLDKLDNNSLIEVYYNGIKYVYKIGLIYEVDKGSIPIYDENKKRVTLITCSKTNKNKQIVYVGYIIDEV